MNSQPMRKRVSVRDLVEFVLRSGSIDSGFTGRNRLEEGTRVHKKLQKAEGYQAEVHLSITEMHAGVDITVEGRADGVIITDSGVTIDEIKSTLTPLGMIEEDEGMLRRHWGQAMCYAHIYCADNSLEQINVRLTYYEMETGGVKRLTRALTAAQLRLFFTELLAEYAAWALFENEWRDTMTGSARALVFPYENYREGQRKLAAAVYRTIVSEGRLFAMAPTGVGKTISTLFPAVKALGEGKGEKVFYLTAKTITRQAAQSALDKMRSGGLRIRSVVITAKDKVCFQEERKCKPAYCKFADGHFDRINGAIMDVLKNCDSITAETVADYAARHRVCPFELSLDLTLWCDVIICDYNYVFDPQVYLRRFFAEGGDYIILVDEAHNMVSRAREMFSASVSKRDFLAAKKAIGAQGSRGRKKNASPCSGTLTAINKILLEKRRECVQQGQGHLIDRKAPEELRGALESFTFEFTKWLAENPDPPQELLETYFNALSFLKISETTTPSYATIYETGRGGELTVKLFCADPSRLLDKTMTLGRAAVLFSATLTPVAYFKDVLGGGDSSMYIALPSPFPRNNLLLLIADDISTRYKHRDASLERAVDLIHITVAEKTGNYIVYFPSYKYLEAAWSVFARKHPDIHAVKQSQGMTEDERDDFLALFQGDSGTIVAFCVLGGLFSEGIDLPGDKLIGTVIVGVGLPQMNIELDIVRDQFTGRGEGYDYAYRFPGMNRVLQAAGRVIRSEDDKGVVLLIDDRFTTRQYLKLFPPHWRDWHAVHGKQELLRELLTFW